MAEECSKMTYIQIEPMSIQEAEIVMAGSDPRAMVIALLGVAMYPEEFEESLAFCERFVTHPNVNLRGIAIEGFGHLARIFRQPLPERILELIRAGLTDAEPWVRGKADDAADDVEFFLKTPIRRKGL